MVNAISVTNVILNFIHMERLRNIFNITPGTTHIGVGLVTRGSTIQVYYTLMWKNSIRNLRSDKYVKGYLSKCSAVQCTVEQQIFACRKF